MNSSYESLQAIDPAGWRRRPRTDPTEARAVAAQEMVRWQDERSHAGR